MNHMQQRRDRSRSRKGPRQSAQILPWLRAWFEPRLLVPALLAALLFPVAQWLFPTPSSVGDAYGYLMTAQRIVTDGYYAYGHEPPGSDIPPNARVTPAWPLALAAVLGLQGGDALGPEEWAQRARMPIMALMLVFTVGIVLASTLSGRALAGEGAGVLAGYMTLLYLPFHRAGSVTLAEHMGAFTLAWTIYAGLRLSAKGQLRTPVSVATFGALCGVLVMVRPNLSLWVFVPIVYAVVMRLESPLRLVRMALIGALGFSLVMGPWWVRNAVVTGRFIPVKSDYVPAQTASAEAGGGEAPVPGPVPIEEPDGSPTEIPSGWEHTSPATVLLRASTPWMPFFDVAWEETYRPEAVHIEYPDRPAAPIPLANAMIGIMTAYHRVILFLAVVALFYVRRSPRLVILLGVPAALLAIHWSHVTIRYFYPPMVAIVLMAAVGAWALYRTLVHKESVEFPATP